MSEEMPNGINIPPPEPDPEVIAREQAIAKEREIARHNEEVRARMRGQTRRSFFAAGGAVLAGYASWRWLMSRRLEDLIPWPMRRVQGINEELWRDYYSTKHLAPDFAGKAPLDDHVNSDIGMQDDL